MQLLISGVLCGSNVVVRLLMQVVACDIDAGQLVMAQRNCMAYGVSGKVSWILGDVFKASVHKVDAVFLSPPWGGPGVIKGNSFDASDTLPGLSWWVPTYMPCGTYFVVFQSPSVPHERLR